MAGPLRTVARMLLLAAGIALTTLPAACGVDFDPDLFCWKCADDSDCGAEYVCKQEGDVGHCVLAHPDPDVADACSPATVD